MMVFQKSLCGGFDNGSDAAPLRRQRFAQQGLEMGRDAARERNGESLRGAAPACDIW